MINFSCEAKKCLGQKEITYSTVPILFIKINLILEVYAKGANHIGFKPSHLLGRKKIVNLQTREACWGNSSTCNLILHESILIYTVYVYTYLTCET